MLTTQPNVEYCSPTTKPKVEFCSLTTKPKLNSVVRLLSLKLNSVVRLPTKKTELKVAHPKTTQLNLTINQLNSALTNLTPEQANLV